jgi:hypothetical protein
MRKTLLIILALLSLGALVAGCGTGAKGFLKTENTDINNDLTRLNDREPLPNLLDSGERRNQNYYYTSIADPNKTWYLALISLDGTPYQTETIRGPVSSSSDEVTNPNQLDCEHNGGSRPDGCGTVGLAEPNGVYQGPDDSHFAILASGGIFKWQGNYVTSDTPFKIQTPVKLSLNETAGPSHTDLNDTQDGKVPPKAPHGG